MPYKPDILTRMIKGVIFDMDGVLADSEEFICEAAITMFAEHGVTAKPEDFIPWVGTGENSYLGNVARQYGFPIDIERDKARTYEIHGEIIKGRLKALPGSVDYVHKVRKKGLKTAVATGADEKKMRDVLVEIGLPLEEFNAVVNGLDVEKGKPAPDIFLKAAEALELPASECLVIEDSLAGLEAALASGARVMGLCTTNPPEKMRSAEWVCTDLSTAPESALEW